MEKISVRSLVEFILRTGDLTSGVGGIRDAGVMHKGSKIHKILQNRAGALYVPEVDFSAVKTVTSDDVSVDIKVSGRADGVIKEDNKVTINEIKSMLRDVTKLEEADALHLAQAKCYGAMYAMNHSAEKIIVRMTYCQMESMNIKEFEHEYESDELAIWFDNLVNEYGKWVIWSIKWKKTRNQSIKEMKFPYEYRKGQYELVKNIYYTILRDKNIFVQAPTGVGKTLSTLFPTISAMGEEIVDKVMYLTAKTITRTAPEESIKLLINNGLVIKSITITAKDKICIKEKADCNPQTCERAKGHFDRVNDAVYDMLLNEKTISRDLILQYAEKYRVCPYEMSLDISNWCDVIICDFNYAFDPVVCLKRFFADDEKKDFVLLIDEAHNLVERGREMYSAVICAGDVRTVKNEVKNYDKHLLRALEAVNRSLLAFKRECDGFAVFDSVGSLVLQLLNAQKAFEDFLNDVMPGIVSLIDREKVLDLYFNIRFFLDISDVIDNNYRIYGDYADDGEFRITLKCMNPSDMLKKYLNKVKTAVYFSATFLPIKYYMKQLGAEADDYAVYAESSFDIDRQLIMAATDVTSRYSRRTPEEFMKMAEYIMRFVSAKMGNYMVFFPSYKMLEDVYEYLPKSGIEYVMQHSDMNESEREEFLDAFQNSEDVTRIGLCVMGGIFGEGIDLRNDRLIGAVIVGTGLPMVGDVRELFRYYYDEINGCGFEYSYLYPGMNKVLQAAGRVIRTIDDKGSILLLDDRFKTNQYSSLFPREWRNIKYVRINEMERYLQDFWERE